MEKRTMVSKIDFRENLGRRFLNVLDAMKDEVRYVGLIYNGLNLLKIVAFSPL